MSSWLLVTEERELFYVLGCEREREVRWGGEKQALSGVILIAGDAKYQSIPAGHNKGSPLQDHTLTIQRKKGGAGGALN